MTTFETMNSIADALVEYTSISTFLKFGIATKEIQQDMLMINQRLTLSYQSLMDGITPNEAADIIYNLDNLSVKKIIMVQLFVGDA